jgi:hypothetical protein
VYGSSESGWIPPDLPAPDNGAGQATSGTTVGLVLQNVPPNVAAYTRAKIPILDTTGGTTIGQLDPQLLGSPVKNIRQMAKLGTSAYALLEDHQRPGKPSSVSAATGLLQRPCGHRANRYHRKLFITPTPYTQMNLFTPKSDNYCPAPCFTSMDKASCLLAQRNSRSWRLYTTAEAGVAGNARV